jgi:hypothetical protein
MKDTGTRIMRRPGLRLFLAFTCLASLGLECGGRVESEPPAPEAPFDAGPADEAGYTRCSTPEGLGICGPATGCEAGSNRPGCFGCTCPAPRPDGGWISPECMPDDPVRSVGMCDNLLAALEGSPCRDGLVHYEWSAAGAYQCIPYSAGLLLSRYLSDPDRIRYADFGLFTGEPLPEPSSCPSVAALRLCGPGCGACADGERCTGRSPLHPHGFCYRDSTWCSLSPSDRAVCREGRACFTYSVEPAAQAVADRRGRCLPRALCEALAAELPGGGACTEQ